MIRNKEETKARILAAVGSVLARSGFQKVGVNAIAKEAGVDKVLIYRYFENLASLLGAYGCSSDFWLTLDEVVDREMLADEKIPFANKMTSMLLRFLHGLQKRPVTQEIMRWELLEQNELTDELHKVREDLGKSLLDILQSQEAIAEEVDLPAISAVLGAGLVFLLLKSKTNNCFLGVDLQSPEGWQRIESAVTYIVQATLQKIETEK
ncbi:TetR/AcrR family transcriptional regulator [Tumidithrix helvetica PCC 7403]|uniref:TetR/AcrR family transcriptional regulator n=1 Tax=Tumidithrix helvetica TaxID=3457545 RepID=UPI003C95A587